MIFSSEDIAVGDAPFTQCFTLPVIFCSQYEAQTRRNTIRIVRERNDAETAKSSPFGDFLQSMRGADAKQYYPYCERLQRSRNRKFLTLWRFFAVNARHATAAIYYTYCKGAQRGRNRKFTPFGDFLQSMRGADATQYCTYCERLQRSRDAKNPKAHLSR